MSGINPTLMPAPDNSTGIADTAMIDAQALARHLDLLFGWCEGFIPLRAFPEKGNAGGRPHLEWIAFVTQGPAWRAGPTGCPRPLYALPQSVSVIFVPRRALRD